MSVGTQEIHPLSGLGVNATKSYKPSVKQANRLSMSLFSFHLPSHFSILLLPTPCPPTSPARPNSHLSFQSKAYLQISNPLSRVHKFTAQESKPPRGL